MGDSAASNEAAYQAALITEQRALDGHTQAIDLLQRLLDSMGDDPLLVQTKTNLQKILENPEVITDEVFNNIMSKTGEILDTNYDQQVQEVLGAARSKGVSGPALQVTLQKAKQARAVAMASAYREAIISRSESGLKTNMEAIASATNLLNQLFTNQRATSQDLATVMREVVPAPFRNSGVDDVQAADPNAGGGGGAGGAGGGSKPLTMDFSQTGGLGAWGENLAKEQAAATETAARATDLAQAKSQAEFEAYWAKWGANGTAAQKAADQAVAGKATPAAVPGTPGMPVGLTADEQLGAQAPASGTGTFEMNGKSYTMDANGSITPVDYTAYDTSKRNGGIPLLYNPNPLSAPSISSPTGRDLMQAQIKSAMAPLSSVASTVQNNFAPGAPISILKPVDYGTTLGAAYNNGNPYTEQTLTTPGAAPIVAGGGAAEATRGAQLVSTYGAPAVIGTTAGFGVRNPAQIVAGSVSAGDKLSDIYDSNAGVRTSATPYSGPVSTASATTASAAAEEKARIAANYAKLQAIAAQGDTGPGGKMAVAYYEELARQQNETKKKPVVPTSSNAGTVIRTTAGEGYRHG